VDRTGSRGNELLLQGGSAAASRLSLQLTGDVWRPPVAGRHSKAGCDVRIARAGLYLRLCCRPSVERACCDFLWGSGPRAVKMEVRSSVLQSAVSGTVD
jgi:hypothetical protein